MINKGTFQYFLCINLFFGACNQGEESIAKSISDNSDSLKHIQRFGMVTGLKPEKLAYYKQLHAATWSAVLIKI